MKHLLRAEELAQFLLCLLVLIGNEVPWWCYALLLIGPDVGMLGYLVNGKVGSVTYNALHHKGIALVLIAIGIQGTMETAYMRLFDTGITELNPMLVLGVILYGHASMDRIFGYGLKFGDSFHHTHLGWLKGPQANENVSR